MTTRTGGCACGAVRYEATADPLFQAACYCRTCQYTAGGSPTLVMGMPAAAFKVTKGEPRVYWVVGDSGARVGRAFCETCGTPVFSVPGEGSGMIAVKIGGLDDPSAFAPMANIYLKDAQPWHHLAEGVAKFDGMPG